MCSQFIFPKPRDWETFEDIVADLLKRRYGTVNLQRYGRRGQGQSGIDIVGPTKTGVLGAQCKHHAEGNIPISEIDAEIDKAEGFPLSLCELIIATSASRDAKAHSHVLALSEKRKQQSQWSVSIIFWEDIIDWLEGYPDLLYKHFTKYFPPSSFEHLKFSGLGLKNHSISWPSTPESIHRIALENLGGIAWVDPYQLTLGVTSFPDTGFYGLVDIEVRLEPSLSEELAPNDFLGHADTLHQLRSAVSNSDFSRELLVHLHTRLTAGFLFGWMFRRVAKFSLQFIAGDELWATDGLPGVASKLFEAPPTLLANDSREVVLVLSLSRHIGDQVYSSVSSWEQKPRAVVELKLEGNVITSAAQALSIAKEISWRIKTYIDQWQIERIHLFSAIPINLAPLIAYHLNAICPIDLYFLDRKRTYYLLAGTITNDL
jgi:hypothetical protein